MAGRFSIEAVFKAVDRMSAPVRTMQTRIGAFAKSIEKTTEQLNSAADKWLGGLKTAAVGIGAAATAGATALAFAAKPGMEFEQAMANVGAVSLMTRDQVKDLEVEARRLGKTTKFSATEVAGGMELMGKAGFTNAQILATIAPVLAAAAAEGANFEEVAGIVSNTLNGMGLDKTAKETQRVADVLTLASARTNSSITSLGESLKNVAPIARQFKVPFETATAAVALLQDVGIDASEAGTATATMLTKLATPSKRAAEMMRHLGIKFQDAKGNMLPLEQVLANFSAAAKKSGGNMKTAAFFAELVGLRGQRAALNLQEAFKSGRFDELVTELGKASGKAQEMANLRMDTLGGDLTKLKNTTGDFMISLYDLKNGALRDVVQAVTAWVDKNSALMMSGVNDFLRGVGDHMKEIVTWGERIGKVLVVLTAASLATKAWAGAMALLNAVAAANPFTLLAIAVIGAVALVWAFWPEITSFFSKVWAGITDLASRLGSAVMALVTPIVGAIQAIWTALTGFLTGVFEAWLGLVTLLMTPVVAIMRFTLDLLTTAAEWLIEAWRPVGEFYAWLFNGIVEIAAFSMGLIVEGATAIVNTYMTIWGALFGFFQELWEKIKGAFLSILGPVWEKITWAIDKLREIGRDTLGTNTTTEGRQVMSPEERAASLSETRNTTSAEVTIRDQTGRAAVTRAPRGPVQLRVRSSGAF